MRDGFCVECDCYYGTDDLSSDYGNTVVDATNQTLALDKSSMAPAFQKQYCAECDAELTNYICPKCDAEFVRDMTTEYHPYLWEMNEKDQLIAHALGVAF